MPTTQETFAKYRTVRADGVEVLTRPTISVAALEAGYNLDAAKVEEAANSAKYPGQLTAEEFSEFCEKNQEDFVSPQAMAKSVSVMAPSGVITRASLQEISKRGVNATGGLSDAEVDALFATLDTENKGAISAEDLMRAMYGEEGAICLAEQRKADSQEAAKQKESREQEAAEREALEEQKKEEEEAANAAAATEAEQKAKEEASKAESKEAKDKAEGGDKASKSSKTSKDKKEKKEKAKGGCC